MPNTDPLFQLITALNPQEKRYFKIHAQKHIQGKYKSNYEKLFDALNYWPHADYDEALFKRRNKGKAFIKNLPVEKKYLHALVLKVLRNYAESDNPFMQMHEHLLNYQIYTKKGMRDMAKQTLKEAAIIADEFERPEYKLLIDFFSLDITTARFVSETELQEQIGAINQTLDAAAIYIRTIYLKRTIFYIQQAGQLNEREAEAKVIFNEAKELSQNQSLPFGNIFSLCIIQLVYLEHKQKFNEMFELTSCLLNKLDNSAKRESYSAIYLRTALNLYLEAAELSGNWDVFPSTLKRYKNLNPARDAIVGAKTFYFLTYYQFAYSIKVRDFKNALQLIKEAEKGLKLYQKVLEQDRLERLILKVIELEYYARNYTSAIDRIASLRSYINQSDMGQASIVKFLVIEWLCQKCLYNTDICGNIYRRLKRLPAKDNFLEPLLSLLNIAGKNTDASTEKLKAQIELLNHITWPTQYNELKEMVLDHFGKYSIHKSVTL